MLSMTLCRQDGFNGFCKIQETINEKGIGNVLILTDNDSTKNYWESKNVRAELINNITDDSIKGIRDKYRFVDTIIITSPKMIARFYNETVNVKVLKAKELFEDFKSHIYILSEYKHVSSNVSNSKNIDDITKNDEVVPKIRTRKNRPFKHLKK